jgi:uncharacterized protein with PIN domain
MAISCSACGRQYDVTLFQFGRTINCACGQRVGLEHKLNLPTAREIKFFADVNVARLVRWLRALGIDTAWEDRIADGELVRRAIEEQRFVLTLDKRLTREWRADNILLLSSDAPLEQFREIIVRFEIRQPAKLFTRCLVCNALLRPANPQEISSSLPLPPAVNKNEHELYCCPNCGKIYWEGSHTRRMRDAIEAVFRQSN